MSIRILIISVICLLASTFISAQVKWVGAGDGVSWNDAANWSTASIPGTTDDIILDNTTVITNYTVNLPSGAVGIIVNSIEITPATGNTIQLILPAGNTSATGLIITSSTAAFTINGGGSFINASASNVEIDGNLLIGSGGVLDVSSGANSPRLSSKGDISIIAPATGAITESGTGNPTIELNGNGPQAISSAAGAWTGDNLDVIISTAGTLNLLSSVFLPHSLTVQAGATVDVSNGTSNFTLGIKGDIVVNGTITESGTSTLSRVALNGTVNQNITVGLGGSITGDELDFRLNNPSGATLLSDLVLPYRYSIVAGNLTLGNYSLTTPFVLQSAPVLTNHIITNGSGFLIIPNVGTNLVIFPIGIDATSVSQVEISNGSGLTYSVRVIPGIHPTITQPFAAIDRTWIINTNSAAANPVPANVTFYYYTGQGGSAFDYSSTVDIGQFITGAWNIVQNGLIPTTNPPEYRAFAPITSFNTPFIVGNHGAILPIDFSIVCKAAKKDNSALINWNVYSEDNVVRYEVEQAVNGGAFKTIEIVKPGSPKLEYSYEDKNLAGGTSIYRIKVVLFDGKIRYSNTVAILFNTKAFLITSIAPNPVSGGTKMTISSPGNAVVKISLFDVQGRVVSQWQQSLSEGTNIIRLETADLRAGIYFLSATDGSTGTNTVRILKQ
ncbi:MAG: T9SS type A sorting domain-containing protein [Bacteroidetes bacterium]|nr:T9SS type A sorting domain-containing protein [Bacteroidota bacterium]